MTLCNCTGTHENVFVGHRPRRVSAASSLAPSSPGFRIQLHCNCPTTIPSGIPDPFLRPRPSRGVKINLDGLNRVLGSLAGSKAFRYNRFEYRPFPA